MCLILASPFVGKVPVSLNLSVCCSTPLGVHCTGSAFRKPFNFSLGVKQCKDPLKLWVHLTAPDLNIDEQKLLTNGATVYLLKDKPIGTGLPVTVSSYVVPNLQKKDNNITISVCI